MIVELIDKYYVSLNHSGSSLISHLQGCSDILSRWGAPSHVMAAARYHTIYSTLTFAPHERIPLFLRPLIAESLGIATERLIYLYAFKSDKDFYEKVDGLAEQEPCFLTLRNDQPAEQITVTDLIEIAAIVLANAAEQAPRLSQKDLQEAKWQRLLYFALPILSNIDPKMPLVDFKLCEERQEILSVPDILEWKNRIALTVLEKHDETCAIGFKELINGIEDDKNSISCKEIYNRLSPLSRMRCALSPKMAARYLHPANWKFSDSIDKVRTWLVSQGILEGVIDGQIPHCLSADDRFFYDAKSQQIVENATVYLIPIDLGNSEYDIVWKMGNHTSDIMPYEIDHITVIIERLERALDFIKSVDAEIIIFIQSAVRLISVRRDNEHINGHGSSSWPHLHGLVGLINVEKKEIPPERTVSALIHEAIHNYLYQLELHFPFSVDTNRFYGIEARSTWTQRTLPLASFLHACLVWFGLANFWKKATYNNPSNKYIQLELEKAVNGFRGQPYASAIASVQTHVRPDVFHILSELPDRLEKSALLQG